MEIVKWAPFRELARIRDDMDRVFGLWAGESGLTERGNWLPAIDVVEGEKELIIKADLPGVKKEDMHITVTEDTVTIEGKTESEKEEKRDTYFTRERRYGAFLRRIPVPVSVNSEAATAVFDKGIVTITLPRVEAKSNGKKIEIL